MAIMLSQLCANTEKAYGMKLIAGQYGLENPVRWVHMIEDCQATDFIHGNELVFTTGIRQSGTDWLLGFVMNLLENNAVGLVINIGPYITVIPPQVIVYCEKNGFPLFTLPWEAHIIDVTYDFCHRIIRNEENETGIATAFRNLIFSPEKKDGYQNTMLRSGFHNESTYTVIAITLGKNMRSSDVKVSEQWKERQFGFTRILKKTPYPTCMFLQENNLIVIRQKTPTDEIVSLTDSLKALVGEGEQLSVGISSENMGWLAVPNLYNEAVSAMTVAGKQNRTAMCYSDIGVYKLLFGVRDTSILADFVRSTLGVLTDYDAKNSTDYTNTLKYYLDSNSSVQEVAMKLNVHRNTINYKIKLIREILNTEFCSNDKMNYMLAFRVKEMLSVE